MEEDHAQLVSHDNYVYLQDEEVLAKLDALEDQGDRRFGGTGLGSELQAYIDKLDKQEPIERSDLLIKF